MREPIRIVGSVSSMMRALLAVVAAGSLLAGCSSSFNATRDAQSSAAQAHWRASVDALGKPISETDLSAWNIDVAPDGHGLPNGSGDVATGGRIFAAKCAVCHGAKGEGLIGDQLIGGAGTLATANPKRTVGSYWPYATTLFDYIRRAMPYNAPQSLSADEVYALSAWILNRNGIVPDDARLDAQTLAAIRMPNRDGFVPDPRPGKL
ncbi:cytochrome C biogenesis protein CcdA [Paraburkholderia monticola]|uniref:Cytochrome C biogenesis protein CcdA n=1 Tax=Paraburkholderia monticola TaxID=1399968 RepID=A0A149PGH3_9BURK|nr:c-type cytochrome [Paraburkholderia monticola]KXU84153.1 cytochrome C biogenesis protein CcdA [Paraburkholderia monticola]